MAIHAQILIGSRKDEEAIDWSKGFGEAFIGQGKQAQGSHGGLPRKGGFVCFWEEKRRKRRMNCEKGC